MARESRYESSLTIQYTTATSDGLGGVVASTPISLITGYACSVWRPKINQATYIRTEYGMAVDADVVLVLGAYNVSIRSGYQFSYDGATYKIRNVTHSRGAGTTLVSTTLVAERMA